MHPRYHPPTKYSLVLHGHRTSISLEPVFWDMLVAAAGERGMSVNGLVAEIDEERIKAPQPPGLAGAVRVWILHHRSN